MAWGKVIWLSALILGTTLSQPIPDPDTQIPFGEYPPCEPYEPVHPCNPCEPSVKYLYGRAPQGSVVLKPSQIRLLREVPDTSLNSCPTSSYTSANTTCYLGKTTTISTSCPDSNIREARPGATPTPAPIEVRPKPVYLPRPASIVVKPAPVQPPKPAPTKVQPPPIQPPAPELLVVTPPRITVPSPPIIGFQPNPPSRFRTSGCAVVSLYQPQPPCPSPCIPSYA